MKGTSKSNSKQKGSCERKKKVDTDDERQRKILCTAGRLVLAETFGPVTRDLLPGRALNLVFLVQRRPGETGQAEGHMGFCPPSTKKHDKRRWVQRQWEMVLMSSSAMQSANTGSGLQQARTCQGHMRRKIVML